jgi:hypothetical protein
MDETETQHGSETDADNEQARKDAKLPISPEGMEILKKLSPEDLLIVSGALNNAAPVAEVEVAAEGLDVAAEGLDVDPEAAPMDAAGGGAVADPALADLAARLAKLEAALSGGGAGDANPNAAPMDGKAPPFGKDKKDGKGKPAVTIDAEAALAAAEAQRDVAVQTARATFDASAKFIGVVRKDGHEADTTTEAATIMLRTISKHLPRLDGAAKALVKAQRLDELLVIYQQAEDVRRDSAIQSQADGVAECMRADNAAGAEVYAFRAPKARGA